MTPTRNDASADRTMASTVEEPRSQRERVLQRKPRGQPERLDSMARTVQGVAAEGTGGTGGALPHLDRIQDAFGRHDVSSVDAHVGGAARDASDRLGAMAYAHGSSVAFRESPDLHTAAHEAAHVVQQRGGVQLKGGVGEAGDRYERQADAVADAVVAGRSAEGLLDGYGSGRGALVVQRKTTDDVVGGDALGAGREDIYDDAGDGATAVGVSAGAAYVIPLKLDVKKEFEWLTLGPIEGSIRVAEAVGTTGESDGHSVSVGIDIGPEGPAVGYEYKKELKDRILGVSAVTAGVNIAPDGGDIGGSLVFPTRSENVDFKLGFTFVKANFGDKDPSKWITFMEAKPTFKVNLGEKEVTTRDGRTITLSAEGEVAVVVTPNLEKLAARAAAQLGVGGAERAAGAGLGIVEGGLIGGGVETVKGLALSMIELQEDKAFARDANVKADAFCEGVLAGTGLGGGGGGDGQPFAAGQKVGRSRRTEAIRYARQRHELAELTEEQIAEMIRTEYQMNAAEVRSKVYGTYGPWFRQEAYEKWRAAAASEGSEASFASRDRYIRAQLGLLGGEVGDVEEPDAGDKSQVGTYDRNRKPRETDESKEWKALSSRLPGEVAEAARKATALGNDLYKKLGTRDVPAARNKHREGQAEWAQGNSYARELEGLPPQDAASAARRVDLANLARDAYTYAADRFEKGLAAWAQGGA